MDVNEEELEKQQESENSTMPSSVQASVQQNSVPKMVEPNSVEEFLPCVDYLKDVCLKQSECLFKHQEFPCKYYHIGLVCKKMDNCKFTHGDALSELALKALYKHIQDPAMENYDSEFVKNVINKYSHQSVKSLIITTQSNLKAGQNLSSKFLFSENENFCNCGQQVMKLFQKWMDSLNQCKMSKVSYYNSALDLYKSIENFELLMEAKEKLLKEISQKIISLEKMKNKKVTTGMTPNVSTVNAPAVNPAENMETPKPLSKRPKLRRRNFLYFFKPKINEAENEQTETLQNVENSVEDTENKETTAEKLDVSEIEPINVEVKEELEDSGIESPVKVKIEPKEPVTKKSEDTETSENEKNADNSNSEDKKPLKKRTRSRNRISVGEYFQNCGGFEGVTTRLRARKAELIAVKQEFHEPSPKIAKIEEPKTECENNAIDAIDAIDAIAAFDSNIIPEIQSPVPEQPIEYKLIQIDIPTAPPYQPKDLPGLLRADTADPRLKKFRLPQQFENRDPRIPVSTNPPSLYYPTTSTLTTVQHMPQWELKECIKKDLDRVQELSVWYKQLDISHQFEVNNSLDALTKELINFHEERRFNPHMRFNVLRTDNGLKLKTILNYLNIIVDEYGKIQDTVPPANHFAVNSEPNFYRSQGRADDNMPYSKPYGFDGRPKRDFYNKHNQNHGRNFRGRFQQRDSWMAKVKTENSHMQEFKGFDNNSNDVTPTQQQTDSIQPEMPFMPTRSHSRSPSPKRQQVQYDDVECWD